MIYPHVNAGCSTLLMNIIDMMYNSTQKVSAWAARSHIDNYQLLLEGVRSQHVLRQGTIFMGRNITFNDVWREI